MDVDEAGCHDVADGVDFCGCGGAGGELSDGRDTTGADREIAGSGGSAGAINERGVADDEVVGLGAKWQRDEQYDQAEKETLSEAHGGKLAPCGPD